MTADRNNVPAVAASSRATVRATVVWAPADGAPREVEVELAAGSSIGEAVAASGLLDSAESASAPTLDLGVFNRPQDPSTVVRDGDRVEIYRPLTVDPKQARRIRADVRRRRKGRG